MAEVDWERLQSKIGISESYRYQINETDVQVFEALRRTFSRFHLDEEFMKNTRFAKPVVAGLLVAALSAKPFVVLLEDVLQIKTALASASYQFKLPVFVGDELTSKVKLEEVRPEKKRIFLSMEVTNQKGEVVLKGEFAEHPMRTRDEEKA